MLGRRNSYRAGHRGDARLPAAWSRRRMIALLLGAGGLAVLLAWGLTLSMLSLVRPGIAETAPPDRPTVAAPTHPAQSGAATAVARDELAARAMPTTRTPISDVYRPWEPAPLSTRDPGAPIVLPPGRGIDQLGVATGFPRTPEGAIAQLASIDQVAMQSGSLPGVRAVISAWAAPGGPGPTTWTGVRSMADLLNSAGLSGAGSPNLSIVFTPAMGLIKGMVGDDFTVVCVDFAVDVTLQSTRSAAVADCQRMLWQDGRWLIGPGAEPAEAESVWPDTDAAFEVGFKDLEPARG
jgi:hypothetical protein